MSDSNDLTIGAILGLFGGIGIFYYGFRILSRLKLIQRTPTSKVRSVAVGQVELKGQAEIEPAPLHSPFANAECVFYTYKIEEYKKRGKNSSWVTIRTGSSSDPFRLRDETGAITIFPAKAELHLNVDEKYQTSPFSISDDERVFKAGLERLGISPTGFLFERKLRCSETYVRPGDQIFIFGTALRHHDRTDSAVNQDNLYIATNEKDYFVISDSSEKELLSSFNWKVYLMVLGGPAVSVASLAYLLNRFNVFR